jgi:hypothetical protein
MKDSLVAGQDYKGEYGYENLIKDKKHKNALYLKS